MSPSSQWNMHDVSDALQWQPAGVETFSSVAGAFIDLIADRLSLDVQSAFEHSQ